MKLIKELKKKIIKDFGKPCEEFCAGCIVCQIWQGFITIESAYFFTEDRIGNKAKLNRPHK